MPPVLLIVAVTIAAALATGGLVDVARRWSLRHALLDTPNDRSSHEVATPRLGGVAFAPVLLGGLLLIGWGQPDLAVDLRSVAILAAVGLVVALVSLADDLRSQPAWLRLVMHLAAACSVALVLRTVPVIDAGPFGVLALNAPASAALTVLWIAGFINAFNFMDGIDGIAGSQALVAGAGWVVFGVLLALPFLTLVGALLLGTAGGFLIHNWSPARIFMGDAGSALLGLLLATVPWTLGRPDLWLASVLLVWPFAFDSAFTLMRRALRGERLWEAHRSHLYQRLVISGWSHRAVAGLYASLSGLGVACGVALLVGSTAVTPIALGGLVVAALALWAMVAHVERLDARAARTRTDA